MLVVFDSDSIRRSVHWRRRDCVLTAELRCRLRLTGISEQLVQRRIRWFGHAARHPGGELIKDPLLPTPLCTWRKRTGGQLKAWTMTIKADLKPLSGLRVFGYTRWRKNWAKVFMSLHWTVEPGVPLSETWSAQLVMPAQPAPFEYRHKHKLVRLPCSINRVLHSRLSQQSRCHLSMEHCQ